MRCCSGLLTGSRQQDLAFFAITVVLVPLRIWCNALDEPPTPDVAAGMHTLVALPVDLYAILLVLNYYRILRYLSYYKSVGVLVLVVNYMLVCLQMPLPYGPAPSTSFV